MVLPVRRFGAIAPLPKLSEKAIKTYQSFLSLAPAATLSLNRKHPSGIDISFALNASEKSQMVAIAPGIADGLCFPSGWHFHPRSIGNGLEVRFTLGNADHWPFQTIPV